MSKRFAPLVCAALLAALLFSLSAAAAPAEPQLYYPTGGVSEWVFSEVPAVGAAPQVSLLDGQTAEAVILQGLQKKEKTIDISSFHLTSEKASSIYMEVVFSHPELFYVKTGARIGIVNGYSSTIMPYYIDGLLSPKTQEAFNARVDKILAETIAPGMSQVEMALSLHDYLVLHCAYDWNVANGRPASSDNVYTAYGALMEGNAVCQGYALAYNLLLNKVRMETEYVTSSTINHGWSLVKIGKTWYHVDVTWDDPLTNLSGFNHDLPGRCDHAYFLVSTETMKKAHDNFRAEDYAAYKTGTTYESDYVFCDASVPFFFLDGKFYYIGRDKVLQSTDNLQNAPAANSSTILAQRHGGTLFARDYFGSFSYGYHMATKQRYELTGLPSSGYGLQEYDDGVYLVQISGSAGVTQGPKLQLPLDGSLHCYNPAVDSKVTVSIQNGQTQKRIVSLCLAAYDQNGKLLSLSWQNVSVASGETKDAVFDLPQGSEAKVFYLDEARRPLRATAAVLP